MPECQNLDDSIFSQNLVVQVVLNPTKKDASYSGDTRVSHGFPCVRQILRQLKSCFEIFGEGPGSMWTIRAPPIGGFPNLSGSSSRDLKAVYQCRWRS